LADENDVNPEDVVDKFKQRPSSMMRFSTLRFLGSNRYHTKSYPWHFKSSILYKLFRRHLCDIVFCSDSSCGADGAFSINDLICKATVECPE
jgi:hypothetical protein